MFKSILAAVKPVSTQKYVVDYAVELATRLRAELTVFTVIDRQRISPPEPMPIGAGSFKVDRDAQRIERAESAAEELLEAGLSAAAASGIECRVERSEGEVVDLLTHRAHEADLLLVGDTADDDGGDESLVVRLLKHAGRPTLVVPEGRLSATMSSWLTTAACKPLVPWPLLRIPGLGSVARCMSYVAMQTPPRHPSRPTWLAAFSNGTPSSRRPSRRPTLPRSRFQPPSSSIEQDY